MITEKNFVLVRNDDLVKLYDNFTDLDELKKFEEEFKATLKFSEDLLAFATEDLKSAQLYERVNISYITIARKLFLFSVFMQRNAEIINSLCNSVPYSSITTEEADEFIAKGQDFTDNYSLFGYLLASGVEET
jgi:hypothetical protein